MTADPLAFLHATLDAVQAEAEAATKGPWFAHEYIDYDCGFEATIGTGRGRQADDKTDVIGHGYEGGGVQKLADAVFIARHNPAAVLRRIAADRKLLERHEAIECREFGCDCDSCCATCRWTDSDERGTEPPRLYPDPHVYPCPTVRLLATGWGWAGETT